MTSLADRTIAALRRTHDDLAAVLPSLSDAQLSGRSGASDWTVAQVLSHLGSGAEITHASYRAALDGTAAPEQDYNEDVWDRWNALTPRDQASEFLEQDATLLRTLEGLTPGQRDDLEIKLGFLPAPLPLATVAGMRLNEAAQHSWDVRVALDPAATLDSDSADVLLEHFTGGMGFLLGFIGKPDQVSQPARVEIEGTDVVIGIGDQVSLSTPATGVTAAFRGEPEAAVRLLCGRLTSPYTPEGVEVTGNLTLDDLRRVFPGF